MAQVSRYIFTKGDVSILLTREMENSEKNLIKMHLVSVTSESLKLGILLAIVGGFLDAYTFVGRGGVFANAQTGNLVLVAIQALKGDWIQTLVQAIPIIAFVLGVILSESIKKNSHILFISNPASAILIFETIILIITGFIPNTVPNFIVTVAISFVSSVQISSFRKLVDSPYATTMCTGNLRSASYAAYIAITRKDSESAVKSLRYFIIIFSFLAGASLGAKLTLSVGVRSIWAAAVILILASILLDTNKRRNRSV